MADPAGGAMSSWLWGGLSMTACGQTLLSSACVSLWLTPEVGLGCLWGAGSQGGSQLLKLQETPGEAGMCWNCGAGSLVWAG